MHLPQPRTLAATLLTGAALAAAEDPAALAARAAALHAQIFTIDTHLDTPTLSLRRPGWEIAQRHEARTDFSQVDFPRMREGGLKAGVFVVYVEQGPRTPAGHAAARDNALRTFVRLREAAARHPQDCGLALTADDGPRLAATGRRALYLSIENGYAIGRDLSLLKTYHDLGARFFGFTHNGNTDLADSSQPDDKGPEWGGLSPLGRDAVRECNRLGLVIDGSHAADTTVRQLLAESQVPILLTHSACRALRDHPRNVSDDLLRAVAARGGVIQITFVSNFLIAAPPNPELARAQARLMAQAAGRPRTDAEEAELDLQVYRLKAELTRTRATFDDLLRHLLHAIEVAGVDHVGIGSDFDGGGGVTGLEDVSGLGRITAALLAHGLSETDVGKIWGGNTLRVLRAAEDFARRARH
jgi:membrane dipeptidase